MSCSNLEIEIIQQIITEPTNEMQLYAGRNKEKILFNFYDYLLFHGNPL
ncbi:MAG: hypothetical protein ACTS73_05770 [Arsenophonus sp. NEOnobi-MAG3]